jgi:hypothetical protein
MTTSGTYSFNPSAADLVLNAFSIIGVRRPEITNHHLEDAYLQANLLMVDISNRSPNRWTLETQSQVLTAGTATYDLSARTLAIAIAYIETTANGVTTGRVLGPISATDYASIPDKDTQGVSTSYFFSLLTTPTITLWPVPDSATTYTLKLQTFRQQQDVNLASGQTIDAPYRFLDAVTTGLAARLAVLYPPKEPGKADKLDALYEKRFALAAARDQERTPMYVRPQMSTYFR